METNGRLREGALKVIESERTTDPRLELEEARATTYHRALLWLSVLGLLFVRRWKSLILVASLPVYTVLVHTSILFINRYFLPAMPAVILLVGAGIWGTGLVAWGWGRRAWSRSRGGEPAESPEGNASEGAVAASETRVVRPDLTRRQWRNATLLAFGVSVVTWAFLDLAVNPAAPLTLEVGSDVPLAGYISSHRRVPLVSTTRAAISPERVSVEGGVSRPVTVTITPLGEVNEKSMGTEVWLYSVASEAQSVDASSWATLGIPAPWVISGAALLNAQGVPVPLEIGLQARGYVDVTLTKHNFSGGVRLVLDGVSRDVDLYDTIGGQYPIRMLLPVGEDVLQRIVVSVPRTADNITLALTGGPRLVRLHRATLDSPNPWSWTPGEQGDVRLDSGVEEVRRTRGPLRARDRRER